MIRAWRSIAVLLCIGIFAAIVVYNLSGNHPFKSMTPAEHLEAAKRESLDDLESVRRAWEHVASLPVNSAEFSAADDLRKRLDEREKALRDKAESNAVPRLTIKDFEGALKNLGYDLTAQQSDNPNEIVVTSADFSDTERRVRFLSFIRGKHTVTGSLCRDGFNAIRLKSSSLPFVGFNNSYSLDCSSEY